MTSVACLHPRNPLGTPGTVVLGPRATDPAACLPACLPGWCRWFWEAVGEMDKQERAQLVQFVTGTSKVPLEGFKALQGISGPQKFQIHKAYGDGGCSGEGGGLRESWLLGCAALAPVRGSAGPFGALRGWRRK